MKKISLNRIYDALNEHSLIVEKNIHNTEISYITYNSRDVKDNSLFFCKGAAFSEKYLDMAQENGAICYISEKKYNNKTDYIIVSDVRKAMAHIANIFFDKAYEKLNLVGITGTKGKSTTAYYVKYILDEYMNDLAEPKTAIVSSIDTYDGVINKESILTTPEAIDLHKHFDNAVNTGIKYFTMEVSSQALKYDRVLDVQYKVGAYLNFGEDHISSIEHSDIEDYFTSKMKLFSQTEIACINLDDDTSERALGYAKACKKIITFSQKDENADVYGYKVKKDGNDITFTVKTPKFTKDFRITMPGLFNVYNALCAISICIALDIPESYMYKGLMKARASGRMEAYSNADKRIVAIVDYAHNSLSFENLYKSVMEEYKGRKIITVFGCPGKKAINRRRDLGTLSGKYSDKVVITEEDFGEEPLINICNDIAGFVKAQGCPYEIVENRGEAIKKAILDCDSDSVVLITGKGNETRLKRGSVYEPCETDVFYAKKYLREYDILHKLDKSEIIKNIHDIFPALQKQNSAVDDKYYTDKHLRDFNIISKLDKEQTIENIFDILPALKKKAGQTIVIKYGGSALENPELIETILEDIGVLSICNINVIIVHGGGKAITAMLNKLNIKTEFINGYRKTTPEIAEIAEMVLKGNIGSDLVNSFKKFSLNAVSISGKDGNLITAEKKHIDGEDIGMVGEVVSVDTTIIKTLLDAGFIPVIAPIASSQNYETLNINADDLACSIAKALQADKLIFLTDIDGILLDQDNPSTVIHSLDIKRAKDLIDSGFVGGGMIPKLLNCVQAVSNGVNCVSIIDGRKKHTILLESLSEKNYGTIIYKSQAQTSTL